MGEYADVKRKRFIQFLRWLEAQNGFSVSYGGAHQIVIKHRDWVRPFPVPFKRNRVNKHYIVELVKKIVSTGVWSKEDIDQHLH